MLTGRVFLTGGTGTLGAALLDRAEREGWDCAFTVYSRDEVKQARLREKHPRQRFVLGDVRDAGWLASQMRGHDTVIHAAACKRVPSIERNTADAVKTNVLGSLNVAQAAATVGVRHAVCVSTDKACLPVNLYGATKMVMERIWQEANGWGDAAFHLVRYGNVIGSRGSVIPLFLRQAAAGGPLTITDRRMTRFWLTIDRGIDLVLRALSLPGGTILAPQARAMAVVDLAACVAPGVPTRVVGIRPGEKLHEMLVHGIEAMHAERRDGAFLIWPRTSGKRGNLPDGFAYTSDRAERVGTDEMRALVERWKETA